MEDLLLMIDSITKEDLNGQVIPNHKWNAIRSRFEEIIKLFNTTRRQFYLRPEVFGLDKDEKPFKYYGVMSDILQDIGLALLEIKQADKFAINFVTQQDGAHRRFGLSSIIVNISFIINNNIFLFL
jgi:hypothetical protein